ncbi:hypothetical protein HanPSC8_Chr03g0099151 [Helianthus annuus]|nr:hypothetical protein HanPSC8_Chr03g0099151 [Helianthus annuus]
MLLRNSPHKDSKKDSPLKSQGIIKDSPTERCCFTDVHIDRIRHCFPANAVFKSFTPTALSDSVSDTWVAFPATPFTIGYSYPFPSFTQSFFSLTGISYIQAMPMIWRVLYTFERIIEQKGIDLGMTELAELYDLTTFGSYRYLLKRKAGEDHPVLKVTKNDTNWKRRFFFVRRDSIPDGKDLPKEWATHGRIEDPRRITISPKLAEIETYLGHVEDQESQIADLQQMGVLKDLKIGDLEKELRVMKAEAAQRLIDMDNEKQEITQDAKVSAAIAMYKIQLQMAEEAQDPTFDKSSWDVEGWKARLADLEDEDEAEDIPMLEGGDADKDQGGAAGGDGAAKE